MGPGVWRDISLLWLILLTLVAILPLGVIFFFLVQGMHSLRQAVKRFLPQAQDKANQVARVAEQVSEKVANPFIEIEAKKAEVDGALKAIRARRTRT